jgi:hypothetical protein
VIFGLAGALMVHFVATIMLSLLVNRSGLRTGALIETLYTFFFLAPQLILCRPWLPVLSRLGLMAGEWWRMPSPLGMLLVNIMYVSVLVALGFAIGQKLRHEQRATSDEPPNARGHDV